jgi:peroxiredoxin Q/BCP
VRHYTEEMIHALLLAAALALAVGSPAPDWKLRGSDGKTYSLADFKGKQGVVLAWFPKAGTSGCTAELRDLRDQADAIAAYDAAVFLISLDPPERNAEFAKTEGAKHVVLSDPTGEVAKAYDVAGGLFAKRWTFYIDKDGTLVAIDKEVNTATAGADIAKKLAELGYPKR